jgi:hypothetical protein
MVGRPDRFKKTCQVSVTVGNGRPGCAVFVDAEAGELVNVFCYRYAIIRLVQVLPPYIQPAEFTRSHTNFFIADTGIEFVGWQIFGAF